MLTKRIIPCLDIKDGRVVKGVNFRSLRDEGSPADLAKKYNEMGADEIVFLDISATEESRETIKSTLEEVAKEVFIPLTVGGGISKLDDVSRLLDLGADKVAINSAAVKHPALIEQISKKYGAQCVVVSIDVKREGENLIVYTHGGKKRTEYSLSSWAKKVIDLGAGELLITSIDNDGMQMGFDTNLYQTLSGLSVPVIASGGAGRNEDFLRVFNETNVTGALAASIFHRDIISIKDLKKYLQENEVNVRYEI
jgi:cyclase